METAILGTGCFWCSEAIFRRLKGVSKVEPGYSGGEGENPTYEEVSGGDSGFVEAVRITFDPKIISFKTLLEVFWKLHDPTTLNRQGADVGPQYRSAIFYMNDEQKSIAEQSKIEHQKDFSSPIVTEITEYKNFYPAEDYHKDYYENNKSKNPYCRIVIDPKIAKLYSEFKDITKEV